MKKVLLFVLFAAAVGFSKQSNAQCSGGNVVITNFVINAQTGQVFYSFNWQYIQGNASIQVGFLCDNVQVGTSDCIPRLIDSTAGTHFFSGSFQTNCPGILKVEIRIHTNPSCGNNYCVAAFRDVPGNILLPVSIKQFSASRNQSVVSLNWQTVSEHNNSGFNIERKTAGGWEQVAFVASKSQTGYSNDVLNYQYSDLNSTKGMSQYRLRQVDLDGKSKYTEIRSVRGDGQSVKTIVYPNPSVDGKVNIVFEETAGAGVSRDISVADMSGRTVKMLKGVTSNNVTITDLTPGMYSLRILVPATGEQSVEKVVVNKR